MANRADAVNDNFSFETPAAVGLMSESVRIARLKRLRAAVTAVDIVIRERERYSRTGSATLDRMLMDRLKAEHDELKAWLATQE